MLYAFDIANPSHFGHQVAVSDNTIIVNEHFQRATAYVYDAATGQDRFKLTAADSAWLDSIAISGNRAVIGGSFVDSQGERQGALYVFDLITGAQLNRITASAGSVFGYRGAVDVSGNIAIIGSNGIERASGLAYLFDVSTGQELFTLAASDAEEGDNFGLSTAIDGNIAVVGAPYEDANGIMNAGSAYVFDVASGQELFKLVASDASRENEFGLSTAISGNVIIVGAQGKDRGAGAAYLFDALTGRELFKLTASDRDQFHGFGHAVAISGNTAIIGAYGAAFDTGAAYLFDVTTGRELTKLTASDAFGGVRFGLTVAISGNTAIVGAPQYRFNAGIAYLFRAVPEPASSLLLMCGATIVAAGPRRCARR